MGENDTKKERGRQRENRRERSQPIWKRRQKESMTARNNEIWKSAWLSRHLKRGINIKHTHTVLRSVRVYFKPVIVPYPSHSVISTSGGSITRLFIENGGSFR